jgi:hypothetical protein
MSFWKNPVSIQFDTHLEQDYYENAVARASRLQTGCLRYIFIIVGAEKRHGNSYGMT